MNAFYVQKILTSQKVISPTYFTFKRTDLLLRGIDALRVGKMRSLAVIHWPLSIRVKVGRHGMQFYPRSLLTLVCMQLTVRAPNSTLMAQNKLSDKTPPPPRSLHFLITTRNATFYASAGYENTIRFK